ncbi:MAG: hypothetical protein A3H88_03870 [Candidatus Blackburnbacteria bacterium RIFCSPLOWO2_02_FULL_44_9]|nr:MAG: hypothetical protein A3H88_03870 [Candidatus Blackburnbacteria bacterium RIFCSPLOWO2_02_FULL_44_9]
MAPSIANQSPSQVLGRVAEWYRRMEQAGLLLDDLQACINDAGLRRRLVHFWQTGGQQTTQVEEPEAHRLARGVMSKNFFGIPEWATHYDVSFSEAQLAQVVGFPWSVDALNGPCPFVEGRRIKDTHFAFLGLDTLGGNPLTLWQLNELHRKGQPKFYSGSGAWYESQPFAIDTACQFRWYLLLKEIVPGSENKGQKAQEQMLPPEYEIPTGVEESAKNLFYYQQTKRYPNQLRYARVRDMTSLGNCVLVGCFGGPGRDVYGWPDRPRPDVGVSASRKSGV